MSIEPLLLLAAGCATDACIAAAGGLGPGTTVPTAAELLAVLCTAVPLPVDTGFEAMAPAATELLAVLCPAVCALVVGCREFAAGLPQPIVLWFSRVLANAALAELLL